MRIAVLVDNNTADALQAEWGLSLYIEYEGHTILLDAGTTGIFADNAKALGTPVENIELAVLSHAHYDHGDGLERFLKKIKRRSVISGAAAEKTVTTGRKISISESRPGFSKLTGKGLRA